MSGAERGAEQGPMNPLVLDLWAAADEYHAGPRPDRLNALADGLAAGRLAIVDVPGPDEPPRVGDWVRHRNGHENRLVTAVATDGLMLRCATQGFRGLSGGSWDLTSDYSLVARAAYVRVGDQ